MNRAVRGLFGPQTKKAQAAYTEEVQELIEDLKRIPIDDLWKLLNGLSEDPTKVAQVMQAYFLILQEINKQRERAKDFQEQTPGMTPKSANTSIDNKQVLYLDVNFLKYW